MSKVNVANLVIETVSPLAITSGLREAAFDTALVRDCNGLPMIPATSIAGVWSHLVEKYFGREIREYWFGRASEGNDDYCRSRFVISHGVLHDQHGQPVRGLVQPRVIDEDGVLKVCVQERPYHRERVAINDRGVAKPHAKFDQIVLPKGLRFSVQVRWEQDGAEPLLALWNLRQMAFGSSTRNGLGQVKLVLSDLECFDLSEGAHIGTRIQHYCRHAPVPENNFLAQEVVGAEHLLAQLPLQALDNWRCGSGAELLGSHGRLEQQVSLITYSEPYWQWQNGQAVWQSAKAVLCGSSIKGILAHRISYHYRRHLQCWAEEISLEASPAQWEEKPAGLNHFFGYADEHDHEKSLAGIFIVDDSELEYEHTALRYHNAIDRFTGGVRKGALYSEELLFKPRFTLRIWLAEPLSYLQSVRQFDPVFKLALESTLEDLKQGLLPFGAGSGRGACLVEQSAHEDWITNLHWLVDQNKEVQR
ncbi:TPA: hypothetical protein RQK93_003637 [Vibrio vulnificus]|nr:hypothetical protein [Vibrio vulnificus]HDY8071400.1 hypothetical protein [Vibrio vulnificus]